MLSRPSSERPVGTVRYWPSACSAASAVIPLPAGTAACKVEFPVIPGHCQSARRQPAKPWRRRWRRRLNALGPDRRHQRNHLNSSLPLAASRCSLISARTSTALREVQAAINAAAWICLLRLPGPVYQGQPGRFAGDGAVADSIRIRRTRCTTRHPTAGAAHFADQGVSEVDVGGGAQPAVRALRSDPTVAATGVSLEEVRGATSPVRQQRQPRPKGAVVG